MTYYTKRNGEEKGPFNIWDLIRIIDINDEICDENKIWDKAYYFPEVLSKYNSMRDVSVRPENNIVSKNIEFPESPITDSGVSYSVLYYVALILALMATNPSLEDHRSTVLDKVNEVLKKSAIQESTDNMWADAGRAIGISLAQGIVEKSISRDNYLIFSFTKSTFAEKEGFIGIGILGKVWLFNESKYNDLFKKEKLNDDVSKNIENGLITTNISNPSAIKNELNPKKPILSCEDAIISICKTSPLIKNQLKKDIYIDVDRHDGYSYIIHVYGVGATSTFTLGWYIYNTFSNKLYNSDTEKEIDFDKNYGAGAVKMCQ